MNLAYLHQSVDRLCAIVDQLGSSFPPPTIVPRGDGFVDRHKPSQKSNGLLCYIKAVKLCSTLNGILCLLDKAFVQEAYALSRISQDQVEDIHYMVIPRGPNQTLDKWQVKASEEFFQEEFDPTDPVGTSSERERLARQKVRTAITNDMDDPSNSNAIAKMTYRTFSGYVHGAYVHTIELHNAFGHYRMHGSPEHLADAINYAPHFVFQAVLAIEFFINRSSRDDLTPQIQELRYDMMSKCEILPNPKD